MSPRHEHAGTLLGELIRQRGQTAEEFSEDAERFARERGLSATLSARHVQRLASGYRRNGEAAGPVRPTTRRLLEEMLGVPINQLLQPLTPAKSNITDSSDEAVELRARIAAGRNVDLPTVSLLRQKLDITRVIDRRLGASTLLGEISGQIRQVERLLGDTLNHAVRVGLSEVLVDASTLAGWQSLDQGLISEAWSHYDRAKRAAREAGSIGLEAYACAGQAVVLLDIGDVESAVELTRHARDIAKGAVPGVLQAWLAAGYGEASAANGSRADCLRAFDDAARSMGAPDTSQVPYLVFDSTHLARWRGSALARLGDTAAIGVLSEVLDRLDPAFARAEAALRVDMAQVLAATNDRDTAAKHAERARLLTYQVGSARQRKRLDLLQMT
jgi:hypothetical protein